MEDNTNELAIVGTDSVLATHSALGGTFCSFNTETAEGKKKVFRATTKPDVTIKSMINKQIKVVEIFAKPTALVDEDTGEVKDGVTVVLFDDLGVSYSATSQGITNAVKALVDIYGHPATWTEPVVIVPKEVAVKKGNMLTFDIM